LVRGGRDWRAYERLRKDEETLFLRKARAVVWGMPPPWEPRRGGRPPSHDPRALVICLLLMRELRRDYRGMESHLRARRGLDALGLRKAPSKSTLHRAAKRLSERYLRMVNDRLVEPFKRGAWLLTPRASARGVTRPG